MSEKTQNAILDAITGSIEIPESGYQLAESRYVDLGEWFGRSDSIFVDNKPHIFPQGSFRLGTVTKPLNGTEEYDLDLACKLSEGFTKLTHSQKELKDFVGSEIERYRAARRIQDELEEKHRCWRLNYQDNLQFHMDIVPCIPESKKRIYEVKQNLINTGMVQEIAHSLTETTVAITDDRDPFYKVIEESQWHLSNPEGYAVWFEIQMKKAGLLLEQRAAFEKVATVDDLPTHTWKSPLQRSVQVLKRHRDVMFESNKDSKPISIILTTLAGRAYNGETDIGEALVNILDGMSKYISSSSPKIPNPVNLAEDFSDRWDTDEGRRLKLEDNFWLWLDQAKADIEIISKSTDSNFVAEQALQKYGARIDKNRLSSKLSSLGVTAAVTQSPKHHQIVEPPKPWNR